MSKNRHRTKALSNHPSADPNLIAILVSVVFLVAPFNRGLFFDDEFFYATAFLALVFGGFWLSRRLTEQTAILPDLISLSAWGLLAAYLISLFVAINLRGAIGEIIRWGTYILVFYLVAYGTRTRKDIDFYLKVLYVTGIGIALAGLGTAFGTFNFKGAFEPDTGRILSTLQYANSLAVYLNTILILGLFLVSRYNSKIVNPLFGAGNYLLFLAFIGTQSRGGWLVFPLVTAIYILLQPGTTRITALGNIVLTMISSFMVSSKVLNFTQGQASGTYWLWLFIGAFIAGVLQLGMLVVSEKLGSLAFLRSSKKGLAIGAGIVLAVIIGGGLLLAQKPELLPEKFVNRVKNINFEQHSVQERFYFYKDAAKIIRDYPLFGTGGKGWEAIYQKYQSYLYLSNQVHSHFLQVWVESGILGFGFFLAIWIAFFVALFKAVKAAQAPEDKSRIIAIGVAALTLGLHSLIDFNLTLGAISLVLWCLFGLGRAAQIIEGGQVKSVPGKIPAQAIGIGTVILAGVLLVASISLVTAIKHGNAAVEAMQRQDIMEAQRELESAQTYDPFQATYVADYAQMLLIIGEQKKAPEMLKQALEQVEKAKKLNPGNGKVRMLKSRINLTSGQIEEGVREVEEALAMGPWIQGYYDNLSEVYFLVGQFYFSNGDQKKAKEYFEKSIGVSELLKKQVAKLTPATKKLWIRAPMLEVSQTMLESARKSSEYLAKL